MWIGGQITAGNIMRVLILPSLVVCIIPTLLIALKFRGKHLNAKVEVDEDRINRNAGRTVLAFGIGFLVFVPVFKTFTHQPPFMGMLLALGVMWILVTVLNKRKDDNDKYELGVDAALQKIDTPSVLFFLGILLSVAALEAFGVLKMLAVFLSNHLHNDYLIGVVWACYLPL